MGAIVGIRHEDKYELERRVPLVPEDVRELVNDSVEIHVQTCPKRIFKDAEYETAGAKVADDLKEADVIFGVKEVTIPSFEDEKTYVFFSHIIKGQEYNMPMLKKMIDKKVNLIDYEKVEDQNNRRLIFFGNYAGLAGMIDTIWAVGLRLEYMGIKNPFKKLRQSRMYDSLTEAKAVLKEISAEIAENGLPEEICPFVTGFTGYGNVSKGAQEIFDILPFEEITPDELMELDKKKLSNKKLYKTVFREEHLAEKKDGGEFILQEYYDHPERFKGVFEKYIPKMTVMMNCVFWTPKYPVLVSKEYLKNNYGKDFKMLAVGDVTCDVHGSVECTELGTPIDDPIYVYNTKENTYKMGYEGEGLLVMSVDILPSELPRESSEFFSRSLKPFVKAISECDYTKPFSEIKLPPEIKKALILLRGEFTPDYEYIQNYLK